VELTDIGIINEGCDVVIVPEELEVL